MQRRRIRACICESFSFCFVVRSSNQHKCNRHGNTINTAAAHVLAALDMLNQSAGCPHLLALKHALSGLRVPIAASVSFQCDHAIKCRHVGVPSPSPAYPAVPCPERHPPPARAAMDFVRRPPTSALSPPLYRDVRQPCDTRHTTASASEFTPPPCGKFTPRASLPAPPSPSTYALPARRPGRADSASTRCTRPSTCP